MEYLLNNEFNEEFFIGLINDIEELIIFKDINFEYKFVNSAFLDFVGKTNEQIIGFDDYSIFPKAEADLIRQKDIDIKSNKKSITFEALLTGVNVQKWVEINKYPTFVRNEYIGTKSIIRDITEKKIKSEKLVESESILMSFFDSGNDMRGIVEVVDNDILHIVDNSNSMKFFGVPKNISTKNKFASEIGVSHENIQLWIKHYLFSQQTNKPVEFEYEHYLSKGVAYLNATVSYIGSSSSGNPRFAYIVENITSKKIIEKALTESELKYRAIFEGTNEGILVADSKTDKALFANSTFAKMFGYENSEIKNLSFKDLHPKSFIEEANLKFLDVNGNDSRLISNVPCLKKDETVFYCDVKDSQVLINGQLCNLGFFTNVTGRRQIESIMQRHHTAMQASANGIVITDKDGIINWANSAFEKMTGFELGEAIGKNPKELIKSGLNTQEYYKNLWDTINSGKVWAGEIINKRKDGTIYYEEMTITPFYDDFESQTYFIAIKTNITKRKLVEIKLKESSDLLNNLSKRVPGAIYQYQYFPNGNSCFPYSSDGIWDIYEVMPDDVKFDATLVFSRIYKDDLQAVTDSILESYKTLNPWVFEYRVELPIKGLRWLRGDAIPEKQADDSVLWHGYLTDITERKNQELIIKESESKFRSYTEDSPLGIFITNKSGKYIEVNSTACELLGYCQDELLQMEIPQIISEKTFEIGINHFKLLIQTGNSTGDILFKKKDGSEFWVSVTARKLSDERYIAFCSDVNEGYLAQEELRKLTLENEKIFNGTQSAMFLVEVINGNEFRFIRNNLAHQRNKAISLNEIVGKTPIEVLGEEIGKQYEANYRRCVESKQTIYIYEENHLNDKQRHWHTSLTPVFEDNVIKFIVGSSIEITELKEAEGKLKNREEQLLTLINASPDIICFKDGRGRWLEANTAQIELFGLTGVGYYKKTGLELIEYSPNFKEALENCEKTDDIAWNNRHITRAVEVFPHTDGKDRLYDIIKVPIFDEFDLRKGIVVLGRDVTDRIEKEFELKSSELKFRTVADHTYDWEYWIGEDNKIKYMSPSCKAISGYSAEEFYRNPNLLNGIVLEKYSEFYNLHHRLTLRPDYNLTDDVEIEILTKDNKIKIIHHICKPIVDDDGNYL